MKPQRKALLLPEYSIGAGILFTNRGTPIQVLTCVPTREPFYH